MSSSEKTRHGEAGFAYLMGESATREIAPGVYVVSGQGNTVVVRTALGLIVTDTGPGGAATRRMIQEVRALSELPVIALVYSHGHLGYNFGARHWLADAERQGHPPPQIIAHARLPARYRRYQETWGLQAHLNYIQFGARFPESPAPEWFVFPDRTFTETCRIDGGDREVIVQAAPSETDDAVALWVPDCAVLYPGPAFIKSIPNVGTPLRTQRDPVRWAETLEQLSAFDPVTLVPEYGKEVRGAEQVRRALLHGARALRFLREETVRRMNQGMSVEEIVHDIDYPEEIFSDPLLKPIYGMPEYIVRDVWRSENGWWDRNIAHLHPEAPEKVAGAIREAIQDPHHVLQCADKHIAEGELQLALHVLDLIPNGTNATAKAAIRKRSEVCEALAAQCDSFVSRQIYKSEAMRLSRS